MARRDALIRLHKSLQSLKKDILRKLAEELDSLRNLKDSDSTGDAADVAFEAGSDEMMSHLAEMDARELTQIERALVRLKQGTYGQCESCGCRIPVGRLNALPYTTLCINCQRELEKYPGWQDRGEGNWDKVYDNGVTPLEEQREVDLSDIEIDLSSGR